MKLQSEDIWADPKLAAKLSQELTEYKNTLQKVQYWDKAVDDCNVLIELYNETEDESLWEELQNTLEVLEKDLTDWEIQATLSGEYDTYDAILTVKIPGKLTESGYMTASNLHITHDAAMEIKTPAVQTYPKIEKIPKAVKTSNAEFANTTSKTLSFNLDFSGK